MPPRRRGPTAIEGLILLAVLGLLMSVFSGSHPPRGTRATSARPAPAVSNEGRGNTLAPPDSRTGRSPEAFPAADRALQKLLRSVFTIALFVVVPILLRLRRQRRSPRRPPQHEHPPDTQE